MAADSLLLPRKNVVAAACKTRLDDHGSCVSRTHARAVSYGEGQSVSYRQIAGISLERLAALSDGIFAVAMTPAGARSFGAASAALHPARPLWAPGSLASERAVWDILRRLAPHLLTYLMSFLTLGIFWVGQQTQLNQLRRSDRDLTWIHLVFLLGVSLMPFSTMLLADYITYRLAVAVYWLNIVLLGALLQASVRYARRARLIKEGVTAEMTAASERRIIAYQALYAFGACYRWSHLPEHRCHLRRPAQRGDYPADLVARPLLSQPGRESSSRHSTPEKKRDGVT